MPLLIYSEMFGLREEENMPKGLSPGSYFRGTSGQWSMLVRQRNAYGRNTDVAWKKIGVNQLPPKIKTLALISGVQL